MTIYEIAKRANVSRATVSRVINGTPGVKEDTRRRVEQVIRESNYIPSAAARSLVSKKSQIIGVLLYNITQPFWSGVLSGLEIGVEREEPDYGLFIVNSKSPSDQWDYQKTYKKNLKKLISRGVDGLVIGLVNDLETEDVDLLEGIRMPFVVIQNHLRDPRVHSVNVDNVRGAGEAAKYLIGLGHRELCHISGPMVSGIARDRAEGFSRAMEEFGLPVTGETLVNGSGFNFHDGYWGMQRILSRDHPPTAVLFPSDMAAFGGIQAASERGFRVPEDLSVMGFDRVADSIDCARLLPDLTTMRQPMNEIGLAAAGRLLERMEGADPEPRSVLLNLTLVEGATCAPPGCSRSH